ncbi:von Willebrand factor A domain-containing protein 5A [Podospora fimiseda]|uniref:von Willebrand factor A domain-containing protein 5A n=1 Tax=Podospora fimiseda TaxID=252190 RepID=A0AAN7BMT8_9PEZI|nr:von Willebrand factor A domain-containing protein 5A [Podospora fimiseda]
MLFGHVCGFYYLAATRRQYLPQLSLSVNAQIISSTSRTTLTQSFVNPQSDPISELRYTFPLYDGVSVVSFKCTINKDRVITGVVQEKAEARKTYNDAIQRGETAGLLEQLPEASDVFTTTVGNVPANATLDVKITYLGELKHDAEVDGIRFTIPTAIAPRYGDYPGELIRSSAVNSGGISITVDAEMADGSNIKTIQSPTHPISITVGNTSKGSVAGAEMSLQKASATLALGTTELDRDFVLHVVATNIANPVAILEEHPRIPHQRALMATLVPKFNLPSTRPEIVFVADRSGSMGSGNRIPDLKTALQLFLKSLPVGVKFNVCSFGSHHEFLFPGGSQSYDASTLEKATRYVQGFDSNFGGTDIYNPMEDVIKKRFKDMNLEVFLLTDGEIWDQEKLFTMLNKHIPESKGAIRVFTLGIGRDVSHSLIEGVARAGNGFAQVVGDNEKMNSKIVRMLKASLTPHVSDYTLEVNYEKESDAPPPYDDDDDFEIVEKVMDALNINVSEPQEEKTAAKSAKPISLFDSSADPDTDIVDSTLDTTAGGKYSHVPAVSEPKFLQAPFVIPPLYPFSRTTVYLLLSPGTIQKKPKSVVLRGTSQHGPLELEIPVTVLPKKGETIHQLAARKATRELEDGRGWIYHAKDNSGKLLKERYEGRFSDMVEREAVRLGVTYQVGGKWTSFVAVEANNGEKSSQSLAAARPQAASKKKSGGLFSIGGGGGLFGSAAKKFSRNSASTPTGGPFGAPPPGAFGGPSTSASTFGATTFGAPAAAPTGFGGMLFGGQAAPPPPPSLRMAAQQPPPMAESAVYDFDESDSENATGFGLFDDAPRSYEFLNEAEVVSGDTLDVIVALQTFEGKWAWSDRLLALLGLKKEDVKVQESDGIATAIVLAYLEVRLGNRKDEWEMLAEKARDWLNAQGIDAEEQIAKVKGLF